MNAKKQQQQCWILKKIPWSIFRLHVVLTSKAYIGNYITLSNSLLFKFLHKSNQKIIFNFFLCSFCLHLVIKIYLFCVLLSTMIGILNVFFFDYCFALLSPTKLVLKDGLWTLLYIFLFFVRIWEKKDCTSFVVAVNMLKLYNLCTWKLFKIATNKKSVVILMQFLYESIDDCRCFSWIHNNHCFTNQKQFFFYFIFTLKFWHLTFYQTKKYTRLPQISSGFYKKNYLKKWKK